MTEKARPGESRGLTPGEIELAKKVFGPGLDYSQVRFQNGKQGLLIGTFEKVGTVMGHGGTTRVPQAICNTVYWPEFSYSDDFSVNGNKQSFIHELTHVWQFQNARLPEGWRTIKDALKNGYDSTYNVTIDPTKEFSDYNVEEQAVMVARYFTLLENRAAAATPAAKAAEDEKEKELLGTLDKFIKDQTYLDQSDRAKLDTAAGLGIWGSGIVAGGGVLKSMPAGALLVVGAHIAEESATTIGDTYAAYWMHDAMVAGQTAAGKFRTSEAPSLANYRQCLFSHTRFSKLLDASRMNGAEKRNDGTVANFDKIDFSDPANIAEFKRMLNTALRQQIKVRDDSESVWPRWLRSDDGAMIHENAITDIKMIESAQREVAMFEREATAHKKVKDACTDAVKSHHDAVKTLTTGLKGATAERTRTLFENFIAAEEGVRRSAEKLPQGLRQQLTVECDVNIARANYALSGLAATPAEGLAALRRTQESMHKAGLDPAREQSYKAIGTTREAFEKRHATLKKEAAAQAPGPKAGTSAPPQQESGAAVFAEKGFLSVQFAQGITRQNNSPAPAMAAISTKQPRLVASSAIAGT